MLLQDIRDCQGPVEALQDFNKAIREKVKALKGRIQVELDLELWLNKRYLNNDKEIPLWR